MTTTTPPAAPASLKHAAFALNVKADTIAEAGGVGHFTGIASAAGVLDMHGEVIEKGAYDATLAAKGGTVVLLWQHDVTKPIGVIHLSVDKKGDLVGVGDINLDTALGREAYSLLKQGAIGAMSIGFNIPTGGAHWDGDHGIMRITQIDLWETSLVTFPANPGATVDAVKAAVAAVVKAGKVLSAKNLSLVEDAINALTALRDAAVVEKSADAPCNWRGQGPHTTTGWTLHDWTGDNACESCKAEQVIDTDAEIPADAIGHPADTAELDGIKQFIERVNCELDRRVRTDV